MKVGLVLPHLGTEGTKQNIEKIALVLKMKALIHCGLQKGFYGR